jgi:glyoxylase-like metal-dependent hydrolase (beta-lactamase superfamily II)
MASTLIYGSEDAVLTDPGLTEDQARVLGDWVAGQGRNVTNIFITNGHGDHWFAAGLLAERFGARVVASTGTITQMHGSVATRPLLWATDGHKWLNVPYDCGIALAGRPGDLRRSFTAAAGYLPPDTGFETANLTPQFSQRGLRRIRR